MSSEQQLTEEQISRYDRQIRLWGVDGQQRLMATSVWLFGIDPISMEVGKNLAAAGVNMTLVDEKPYVGQLVSVIPHENMFKPMSSLGAWYAECLRHMNEIILIKAAARVDAENVTNCWAVGRADNEALGQTGPASIGFGNGLIYSVGDSCVEIWNGLTHEGIQRGVENAKCALEAPEAAVIGGLIAQYITNAIASKENRVADWQKIVYDRAKMCANTCFIQTKNDLKTTSDFEAVEID